MVIVVPKFLTASSEAGSKMEVPIGPSIAQNAIINTIARLRFGGRFLASWYSGMRQNLESKPRRFFAGTICDSSNFIVVILESNVEDFVNSFPSFSCSAEVCLESLDDTEDVSSLRGTECSEESVVSKESGLGECFDNVIFCNRCIVEGLLLPLIFAISFLA